jgi:hypothetical protein
MNLLRVFLMFGRLLKPGVFPDRLANARRALAVTRDSSQDGRPLEKSDPIVHLDMNLSSSFDDLNPERPVAKVRPTWVPVKSTDKDVMRTFYVDLLSMTEINAPEQTVNAEGLWLTNGMRTLYLGPEPVFAHVIENPLRLRLPQLDKANAGLVAAGYRAQIDESLTYARRMTVSDPAGNILALVGA